MRKEKNGKSNFFSDLKVDIQKSTESWVIHLINFLYLILFICPSFITVNKPGCDVEVVGYFVILSILLLCAFFYFAFRLRHINYENKNYANWIIVLGLASTGLCFAGAFGMGWIILMELIATLPMTGAGIYIKIRYRNEKKDF